MGFLSSSMLFLCVDVMVPGVLEGGETTNICSSSCCVNPTAETPDDFFPSCPL